MTAGPLDIYFGMTQGVSTYVLHMYCRTGVCTFFTFTAVQVYVCVFVVYCCVIRETHCCYYGCDCIAYINNFLVRKLIFLYSPVLTIISPLLHLSLPLYFSLLLPHSNSLFPTVYTSISSLPLYLPSPFLSCPIPSV